MCVCQCVCGMCVCLVRVGELARKAIMVDKQLFELLLLLLYKLSMCPDKYAKVRLLSMCPDRYAKVRQGIYNIDIVSAAGERGELNRLALKHDSSLAISLIGLGLV